MATAEELARRGAKVAIGDVDGDASEAAASGLAGEAIGLALDVTDRDSFAAFLDAAEERLGPLDVLVNNAGVMVVGPFADQDDAAADRVLDVNLGGVVIGMRLAIPRLRAGGQIVNVVSASAFVAPPALSTYAASKHAVHAFTQSVARRASAERDHRDRRISQRGGHPAGRGHPPGPRGQVARTRGRSRPPSPTRSSGQRDEVFIPRSLSVALRLQSALPPRAKALVWRLLGLTTLYTSADTKAREEYESGVGGGLGAVGTCGGSRCWAMI